MAKNHELYQKRNCQLVEYILVISVKPINGARRSSATISNVAAITLIHIASGSFMPICLYSILVMYDKLLSMRSFLLECFSSDEDCKGFD